MAELNDFENDQELNNAINEDDLDKEIILDDSIGSTNEKKRRQKRELRSWIICIVGAIILATILRLFVFEFVMVEGKSMVPTLQDGERVFVEKISKYSGNFGRGDIVIIRYPNREGIFVKRIIGVENDTVAVKGGSVYVNGHAVEESYIKERITYEMDEVTVPPGHVFVMGDNRNDSLDSHRHEVGPLDIDNIAGHALFIIWPLDKIAGLSI